jgi:hypothetical protein
MRGLLSLVVALILVVIALVRRARQHETRLKRLEGRWEELH